MYMASWLPLKILSGVIILSNLKIKIFDWPHPIQNVQMYWLAAYTLSVDACFCAWLAVSCAPLCEALLILLYIVWQ